MDINSKMDECAICMNAQAGYRMKGCSHSICRECATTMGEDEKYHYEPFGEFVQLNFNIPLLECPFCRAKEPMTPKVRNWLNKHYWGAYEIWFETELFKGPDGTMYYTSFRKNNVRIFPNDESWCFWSLMERAPRSERSTGCYCGYVNLFDDLNLFEIFEPPKHRYPHARKV